ncbi:peptidase U32 family protein [soil metagenome]
MIRNKKNKKIQLLAPAGSFTCLATAIQAGADAVYFGIDKLNMRSNGNNNFTLEDLAEITTTCHNAGLAAYLTLNTVMYDHDLMFVRSIIKSAKKNKVDAIIAHDIAVISLVREAGLPIHISTQANVTNIESIKFYAAFADLIVLSRELSLEQIKIITKEIVRKKIKGASGELIKIEVFIHGALCMATSGKCYISLHTNYASANRGACVQNCRRKYIVRDADSGHEFRLENDYIMSAKDLCTIDFLDKIIESGVSVLKIEGRGRSEDYVFAVTKCYREAITSIEENSFTELKVKLWKEELGKVFNRGFWEGYYLGRETGEWHNSDGSAATQKKVLIGKGERYYPKIKVAEIRLESNELKIGDEIMVSGPVDGVHYETIKEMRVDDICREKVIKGELVSIPIARKIRSTDKIYKIIQQ